MTDIQETPLFDEETAQWFTSNPHDAEALKRLNPFLIWEEPRGIKKVMQYAVPFIRLLLDWVSFYLEFLCRHGFRAWFGLVAQPITARIRTIVPSRATPQQEFSESNLNPVIEGL